MDKNKIKNALESLLSDFQQLDVMTFDEIDNVEASIENIELIAKELDIELDIEPTN